MIHNTGAYGPNEAPINMGAPVNMSQLKVPMIPPNLNNLSKMPQQAPHPPAVGYNLPNFSPYAHQSLNMNPQMPHFPTYPSNVFHSSFMAPQTSSLIETGWQNGLLPMNLNMPSEQMPHSLNFQHFDKAPNNDYENSEMYPKIPLNIPKYPIETQQKQVPISIPQLETNVNHQKPPNTNTKLESDQNLGLNTKHTEILEHDNTRRKTIENTIRLIENILVNTTKNRDIGNNENDMQNSQECENNDVKEETEIKLHNTNNNQAASSHEMSECQEDVKPVIIKDNDKANVYVKVEPWSMEEDSIFLRDSNAVSREEVMDCRVVDCETSVMEAMEDIKNGSPSVTYYECPHCHLLLRHPKKFLIHTKWHMFGLTRSKRLELARVKSERRIQLREARMVDRSMKNLVAGDDAEKAVTYPCKDCDKVFMTKSTLKNHRGKHHATRTRECKICKKTIIGWMALRAHIASHTDDSGYQCDDCPKRFKYPHSLAKHRDTHLEKTHGCDQCPKKFGSQALLKMHMKCHERALRGTSFRCTYCGKGFYEVWNLQVHERTHRNERPFLCEICNTAFGTNSSLKRHIKVSHSSSKPHECGTCHRCFVSAAILERHERRAHGDPEDFKFVCRLCGCRYMTSKDLQKHVYKVHPKGKRKRKTESDSE